MHPSVILILASLPFVGLGYLYLLAATTDMRDFEFCSARNMLRMSNLWFMVAGTMAASAVLVFVTEG